MDTLYTLIALAAIFAVGYGVYKHRAKRTKDRTGPDNPDRHGI